MFETGIVIKVHPFGSRKYFPFGQALPIQKCLDQDYQEKENHVD